MPCKSSLAAVAAGRSASKLHPAIHCDVLPRQPTHLPVICWHSPLASSENGLVPAAATTRMRSLQLQQQQHMFCRWQRPQQHSSQSTHQPAQQGDQDQRPQQEQHRQLQHYGRHWQQQASSQLANQPHLVDQWQQPQQHNSNQVALQLDGKRQQPHLHLQRSKIVSMAAKADAALSAALKGCKSWLALHALLKQDRQSLGMQQQKKQQKPYQQHVWKHLNSYQARVVVQHAAILAGESMTAGALAPQLLRMLQVLLLRAVAGVPAGNAVAAAKVLQAMWKLQDLQCKLQGQPQQQQGQHKQQLQAQQRLGLLLLQRMCAGYAQGKAAMALQAGSQASAPAGTPAAFAEEDEEEEEEEAHGMTAGEGGSPAKAIDTTAHRQLQFALRNQNLLADVSQAVLQLHLEPPLEWQAWYWAASLAIMQQEQKQSQEQQGHTNHGQQLTQQQMQHGQHWSVGRHDQQRQQDMHLLRHGQRQQQQQPAHVNSWFLVSSLQLAHYLKLLQVQPPEPNPQHQHLQQNSNGLFSTRSPQLNKHHRRQRQPSLPEQQWLDIWCTTAAALPHPFPTRVLLTVLSCAQQLQLQLSCSFFHRHLIASEVPSMGRYQLLRLLQLLPGVCRTSSAAMQQGKQQQQLAQLLPQDWSAAAAAALPAAAMVDNGTNGAVRRRLLRLPDVLRAAVLLQLPLDYQAVQVLLQILLHPAFEAVHQPGIQAGATSLQKSSSSSGSFQSSGGSSSGGSNGTVRSSSTLASHRLSGNSIGSCAATCIDSKKFSVLQVVPPRTAGLAVLALAKLSVQQPPAPTLLQQLQQQLLPLLPHSDMHTLLQLLWAFAVCWKVMPSRWFLLELVAAFEPLLSSSAAKQLQLLGGGVSLLRIRPPASWLTQYLRAAAMLMGPSRDIQHSGQQRSSQQQHLHGTGLQTQQCDSVRSSSGQLGGLLQVEQRPNHQAALQQQQRSLSGGFLANVAYSLAKLGVVPTLPWRQVWQQHVAAQVSNMDADELVDVLYAAAVWAKGAHRVAYAPKPVAASSEIKGQASKAAMGQNVCVQAAVQQLRQHLSQCTPSQLTTTLWALGQLGLKAPVPWLDALYDALLVQLQSCSMLQLQQLLRGLIHQEHVLAPARIDQVLKTAQQRFVTDCTQQQLVRLLQLVVQLHHNPEPEWGEAVATAAERMLVQQQQQQQQPSLQMSTSQISSGGAAAHGITIAVGSSTSSGSRYHSSSAWQPGLLAGLLDGLSQLDVSLTDQWQRSYRRATRHLLSHFTGAQLTRLLSAMALLHWKGLPRPFMQQLLQQLRRQLAYMGSHDMGLAGVAVGQLGLNLRILWCDAYMQKVQQLVGTRVIVTDVANLQRSVQYIRWCASGQNRVHSRPQRHILGKQKRARQQATVDKFRKVTCTTPQGKPALFEGPEEG